MRVLQLIDSLQAGGAERMAVNYANALVPHIEKSYLCATRQEGPLLKVVNSQVGYLFLNRKKTIDRRAFLKLKRFIKNNEIGIIHAHGSSFFIAALQKMLSPRVVLVWHDHYGNELKGRRSFVLRLCSGIFDCIFSVNVDLKRWAETTLRHKRVYYIKNFIVPQERNTAYENTFQGVVGKRIVCVANLRPVKNHGLLLDAFAKVLAEEPEATLHLFGSQFNDIYAQSILQIIKADVPKVYYHGTHPTITEILPYFDLGVLSSDSEGLPLALLEYGQAALPVVVTNVGQCKEVLSGHGHSVEAGDGKGLAKAMGAYLKNPSQAEKSGRAFQRHILDNYGGDAILSRVLKIYEQTSQRK
jgi:glycosyltransferase involved in cell wall biosynthesis